MIIVAHLLSWDWHYLNDHCHCIVIYRDVCLTKPRTLNPRLKIPLTRHIIRPSKGVTRSG